MKLGIIGAGSSYTPELIEKLLFMNDELKISTVSLMDIDQKRLNIIAEYFRRAAAAKEISLAVTATTDRRECIRRADFIITQIRVGGNAARSLDAKIPLKYGCVGQETTGAGGFANALRTLPVMTEIGREVESLAPEAWIVNYTNPTGLVTEAVRKYTDANIVGLCAGALQTAKLVSEELKTVEDTVYYDYFGLNHLNFAYNIKINGKPVTEEQFETILHRLKSVDHDLVRTLGIIPITYLQYYFHTRKKVEALKNKPKTRGEEILELEEELFSLYSDPHVTSRPKVLSKRGGGGYSDIAFGFIDAVWNNKTKRIIVNTPNRGSVKLLPDDAVIEVPCLVNRSGVHPLVTEEIPSTVWGLVAAVKNYEQLTVEAAVEGDREKALLALMAHPLVKDWETAVPLLEDILNAHRQYLPQFYKQSVHM